LYPLSLSLFVQDVVIAIGAGIALIAFLLFINLGVLLPGLLTSLGGPQPDQRGAYLEFGPAGAPIVSEPAPRDMAPLETTPNPPTVVRPHLWHWVSGAGPNQLTSSTDAVTR
jgi:hypothetical protein